ncbi:hypothetical protein [Saccharothrix coeruleofusca]|uniref:Uncharacterized protein n=1 Tax=Saccharothrix coeruleofusca TaxID=33919 RepID=A0A918ARG4_9PSEU|nr:hypothetical protein [Saccharothrix coeruleofusca]MBP2335394.1 hypothetical protein [Saccharothrix coeruleofusca]GGP77564.1 hypothetical protein GCM10010185_59100 [Saccharothrix coeruleofusca]
MSLAISGAAVEVPTEVRRELTGPVVAALSGGRVEVECGAYGEHTRMEGRGGWVRWSWTTTRRCARASRTGCRRARRRSGAKYETCVLQAAREGSKVAAASYDKGDGYDKSPVIWK